MRFVLISRSGKRKLVDSSKDIHTDKGVIPKSKIKPGKLKTHKGEEYVIAHPGLDDLVESMRMGAKPLFGYDTSIFAYLLGLKRGKSIIEAGTGSGGSAIVFANYIHPGQVYTFEKDERFYNIAKRNISEAGVDNVQLVNDDVREASRYVSKVDAIFLDLQNPDDLIPELVDLLVDGGRIGVYTPIFDSIKPVWKELENQGFVSINAIELGFRKIVVKKYARFSQRLFGFPGFFVWGTKF